MSITQSGLGRCHESAGEGEWVGLPPYVATYRRPRLAGIARVTGVWKATSGAGQRAHASGFAIALDDRQALVLNELT